MPKLSSHDVESEVSFYQPDLAVREDEKHIVLSGDFIVTDGSKNADSSGPLTRYSVEIFVPRNFPNGEPTVFETGGRIPRVLDRHIYPKWGACCITIWETWLLLEPNKTVLQYLMGPVNSYFFSQFYFERKQVWPLGEWKHGEQGILDAYGEMLGCEPEENAVRRYLNTLTPKWPKGHLQCPCGSGEPLRRCHRSEIEVIHERIPPNVAAQMLRKINALTRP